MVLEKNMLISKTGLDLLKGFEKYHINLNKIKIDCGKDDLRGCMFDTNQKAVEFFIQNFKSPNTFPAFDQLDLIIQFHKSAQYRAGITFDFAKTFILNSQKPMIEKQYLSAWLQDIYNINLSCITMCSISPPNMTTPESLIQSRLIGLLCLFYNLSPIEVTELQLFSVVYVKPYYCFKSHCGNFVLVLPPGYSNYINKCIQQCTVCDMQSCSQYIDSDFVRSFCYHNKNKIFGHKV